MPFQRRKTVKILGVICAAVTLIIVGVAALLRHPKLAVRLPVASGSLPLPAPQTTAFHVTGSQTETHVPFTLRGGSIVVDALINGKPEKCFVDTGCSSVLWNSRLHLTDQRTGVQSSISDAGGHTSSVQEALLTRVQIGGLDLHDVISDAVTSSSFEAEMGPILGNSVFAGTVLTINYHKQELIIQPPLRYNVMSRIKYPQNVLDFHWINPDLHGMFGVPCFRAKVMTLPAEMTLDTGWVDNSLGLTTSFYRRLDSQLKASHSKIRSSTSTFALGQALVTTVSGLSSSFAGITLLSSGTVVNTLSPPAQAILGYGFLKNCRTTIDYPDKKIWFEGIPAGQGRSSSK
jgi:predicted aspartyl protease